MRSHLKHRQMSSEFGGKVAGALRTGGACLRPDGKSISPSQRQLLVLVGDEIVVANVLEEMTHINLVVPRPDDSPGKQMQHFGKLNKLMLSVKLFNCQQLSDKFIYQG